MSSLAFDGSMVPTMRASEAAVSTVADIVHRLRADCSKGLTTEQVEKRREVHGFNEFEIKEDDPLWRKYINQVGSFLTAVSAVRGGHYLEWWLASLFCTFSSTTL